MRPIFGRKRTSAKASRTGRVRRRSVFLLLIMAAFMLTPLGPAAAGPFGPDACAPADAPAPEAYGSGSDGLIKPPDYPTEEQKKALGNQLTHYDRYGTAGQTWYAVDMGCGDAMSLMGNSVANTVFTLVRAIDRTTIAVYQAAASESLLGWLKDTVDDVIKNMGKTFNARYWTPVVILGAIHSRLVGSRPEAYVQGRRGHHLDGRRDGRPHLADLSPRRLHDSWDHRLERHEHGVQRGVAAELRRNDLYPHARGPASRRHGQARCDHSQRERPVGGAGLQALADGGVRYDRSRSASRQGQR
ncbi:hypothetical protein GCM10027589_52570 [Actinocorallia lasiicapitis]